MSDDASLTDFVGDATDDEPRDESSTSEDEQAGEESGRVSPDSVEPAATTAAWSPDGEPCRACGASVSYRWQGEDGLVCPDCKEW